MRHQPPAKEHAMPGFNDTDAIAVYATDPGATFRVPTVQQSQGFDVHFEAEAGSGLFAGGAGNTPFFVTVRIVNITGFKLVTITTNDPNATGQNIGKNQFWKVNDQEFVFKVGPASGDIQSGDFLQILATLESGGTQGDPANDYSHVMSEIFLVI
jgi:hypothetical protein